LAWIVGGFQLSALSFRRRGFAAAIELAPQSGAAES
jgi:hypothetical protein